MDRADSKALLNSLIPTKNYDQLSLGDLLMELYKENIALDKADKVNELANSKAAKSGEEKAVKK